MDNAGIPTETNNLPDNTEHSVSVEDILTTIDMFLKNKFLDDVPSSTILKILRLRITDPYS